jgi:hypothetical protein
MNSSRPWHTWIKPETVITVKMLMMMSDNIAWNTYSSQMNSSRPWHTWIKPEAVITVKMLLMMSENIAWNTYSSQGTINYPTQFHLVGHFCKNRIMMHGSMNVTFKVPLVRRLLMFIRTCTRPLRLYAAFIDVMWPVLRTNQYSIHLIPNCASGEPPLPTFTRRGS